MTARYRRRDREASVGWRSRAHHAERPAAHIGDRRAAPSADPDAGFGVGFEVAHPLRVGSNGGNDTRSPMRVAINGTCRGRPEVRPVVSRSTRPPPAGGGEKDPDLAIGLHEAVEGSEADAAGRVAEGVHGPANRRRPGSHPRRRGDMAHTVFLYADSAGLALLDQRRSSANLNSRTVRASSAASKLVVRGTPGDVLRGGR